MIKIGFVGAKGRYIQRRFLAGEYFERGTVCCLVGDPGLGKTTLKTYLTYSLARGTSWFGRDVSGGPVLCLCGEGSVSTENRLMSLAKRDAVEIPELQNQIMITENVDFSQQSYLEDLYKKICAIGDSTGQYPVLITIDTLAQCMGDVNEDDASKIVPVMRRIRKLAQLTNACVLILAHPPRSKSNRPRGSNAIDGEMDLILYLAKTGNSIELRVQKIRDGRPGTIGKFKISGYTYQNDDGTSVEYPVISECSQASASYSTQPLAQDHMGGFKRPRSLNKTDKVCQLVASMPDTDFTSSELQGQLLKTGVSKTKDAARKLVERCILNDSLQRSEPHGYLVLANSWSIENTGQRTADTIPPL